MAGRNIADKIKITTYDELFGGIPEGDTGQKVTDVKLNQLIPFKEHPFQVRDDEEMKRLVESVKENGVIVPALVRPAQGTSYELISGHRRKRAAELAGFDSLPVIIREISDDEAVIAMVDANLQREKLLPSEKAFAYRMKVEAIKHQGKVDPSTSAQVGQKLFSRDAVAAEAGESKSQVQRYIRLTYLHPRFLSMVDEETMGFNIGVELSFLTNEEQEDVIAVLSEMMIHHPSMEQAKRIKRLHNEDRCNRGNIEAALLSGRPSSKAIVFNEKRIRSYFPEGTSGEEIMLTIYTLLDRWIAEQEAADGEI